MVATARETQFFEVSDVARELAVADATVRLWERTKLIPPPARTPGGRRIFTRGDIDAIRKWRAGRAAARGGRESDAA